MQPKTQSLLEALAALTTEITDLDCGPRISIRALPLVTALQDLIHENPAELSPEPSMEEIVQKVADVLHVNVREILSKCRSQHISAARQICFYFCRKLSRRSFPEIGRFFDRDHATVIHGVRLIEKRAASSLFSSSLLRMERALMPQEQAVAA